MFFWFDMCACDCGWGAEVVGNMYTNGPSVSPVDMVISHRTCGHKYGQVPSMSSIVVYCFDLFWP